MSIDDLQKVVNVAKSMFSFLIPSKRECLVKDDEGRSFYVIETKLFHTSDFTDPHDGSRKQKCYVVYCVTSRKTFIYWKQ